jgi:hypothetical protein
MDPQVTALPGAGPQEIVAQTTDPQVIDPHGSDPQRSAAPPGAGPQEISLKILKWPLFLEQAHKRSSLKRQILKWSFLMVQILK